MNYEKMYLDLWGDFATERLANDKAIVEAIKILLNRIPVIMRKEIFGEFEK